MIEDTIRDDATVHLKTAFAGEGSAASRQHQTLGRRNWLTSSTRHYKLPRP